MGYAAGGATRNTPPATAAVLTRGQTMRAVIMAMGLAFLSVSAANAQLVSFTALETEPFIEGSPLAVAAADVDKDGKIDLVGTNTDLDTITVFFGNGDGTFTEPGSVYSLETSASPDSIVLADFNNDHAPDIITANEVTNTVTVLLNDGTGIFDLPVETTVGTSPADVAVGDFNRDGKLDAVSADAYDDTVTVLLGSGNGAFAAPQAIPVGSGPASVAVADLDGDGKLDLIVADSSSGDEFVGAITILKGAGDGTFTAQPEIMSDAFDTPVAVRAADLNGDHKTDFVVLNQELDDVAVFLGNGDLSFQAPMSAPVSAVPNALELADFNGDGIMDIATSGEFEDKIAVLVGLGDGTFAPFVEFDVGVAPHGLAVGDFNKDQKLDLATANQDSETATILLNTTSSGATCGGDCSMDGEVTVDELVRMVNIALGAAPVSGCSAGDTNLDGEITIDEIIAGVSHALNGCAL